MIKANRLGHLSLRTPDVERLRAHYVDLLDFKEVDRGGDGTVYLTTDPGHHSLAISPAGDGGLDRIAWQVAAQSLDDVAAELERHGLPAERRSDPEPGISELIATTDNEGNALHLYVAKEDGGDTRTASVRPQKLGHVCYFVEDINATVAFYETVFDFRWSDWMGDFFVFLRCGPEHHTLNLLKSPNNHRLHHIGYEVRDWAHVQLAVDRLAMHQIPLAWGPGRHGPGHNVFTYHRDPDGNVVELFCELDLILDESLGVFEPRPWHQDFPQRPKVWAPGPLVPNAWGPLPPEGFLA